MSEPAQAHNRLGVNIALQHHPLSLRLRRDGSAFAWLPPGEADGIGLDKRTGRRIVGSGVADYERLTHKKTGPPGPETAGRGTVAGRAES